MKLLFVAAIAAAASPALAQDPHAGHAKPAASAAPVAAPSAARLNLDTPVEAIVADAAGKTVLDANLPELATHPQYDAFKQLGLRQLANFAPDKLTPEVMARIEAGLAAIK